MSAAKRSEFHVADLDLSNISKIEGLKRRGLMFILAAPSGTGKTTIARRLLDVDPDTMFSISCTTRPAKAGEVDGVDYHFLTPEAFQEKVDQGLFLEHATYVGNMYGTLKAPVIKALEEGKDVLFDIEWQGAAQILEQAPTDVVRISILPPSAEELRNRLNKRGRDSAESIEKRLKTALDELTRYECYDYVVINSHLEDSLYKLRTILGSERMKRHRLRGLSDFVTNLRQGF